MNVFLEGGPASGLEAHLDDDVTVPPTWVVTNDVTGETATYDLAMSMKGDLIFTWRADQVPEPGLPTTVAAPPDVIGMRIAGWDDDETGPQG